VANGAPSEALAPRSKQSEPKFATVGVELLGARPPKQAGH
jgi:hypothetical protein